MAQSGIEVNMDATVVMCMSGLLFLFLSLQPLMDNLDSQTYEIFEKDPVKYAQYEKVRACNNRVTMVSIKCKLIKTPIEKFCIGIPKCFIVLFISLFWVYS